VPFEKDKTMVRFYLLALLFLFTAPLAGAQGFPERPVKLVVPFAAGGTLDVIGRPIAEQFQRITGQPLLLENRAGAAGTIAADHVWSCRVFMPLRLLV
jgi:tripartite-type tricarboxylate transporter receptor subunit TctC